jgi:LysR family transcriptional regulator, glycine cleavage system transcriptional activator
VCPRDHLRHRKVKIFLDWIRAARDDWREQSGSRPWIADRQQ